ncbi:MAG: sulfite exporter TauE/SafE family protein [bacterium]
MFETITNYAGYLGNISFLTYPVTLFLGFLAGTTFITCCLPALPIVLTYAAIRGRPLHGALIMAAFAAGQSIPLFAVGLFDNLLSGFAGRWSVYVRRIAGFLLLCAGIYFILRG